MPNLQAILTSPWLDFVHCSVLTVSSVAAIRSPAVEGVSGTIALSVLVMWTIWHVAGLRARFERTTTHPARW